MKAHPHRRITLLTVITALILYIFAMRLAWIQLVKGDEYLLRAQGAVTYSFTVEAVRGRIFDRNGVELATTGLSYNIELNNLMLGDTDLNETIRRLLTMLQGTGDSWIDTLPVTLLEDGKSYDMAYTSDNAELIAHLKADLNLQQYATADQIMIQLVARYGLENYDPTWQRYLAGVRRQMEVDGFSEQLNYTLARDISAEAVATIRENGLNGNGVEVLDTTIRDYPNSSIASPILGRVGPISSEAWVMDNFALSAKGYQYDDLIGIDGIEALCETDLRGVDGELSIVRTSDGSVLSREITQETVPGVSPVLTMDATIQAQTNRLLEAHIQMLQATKGYGQGRECNAGAVVILDCKTGGILAASNYPTYDLEDFAAHYEEYLARDDAPLFNRAFLGTYAPGSAFKPVVALAGLLSGECTPEQQVNCTGVYAYYDGYHPTCLQVSHEGPIALHDALKYSCNLYFYDLGRRVGVERIASMARHLGLGTKTGLELHEATGRLTSSGDDNYTDELTLQAAIGQGNNAFTPVQLATYANTLANKGGRQLTHILYGYYNEQTGTFDGPYANSVIDMVVDNIGAFDAVEAGMVAVSETLPALRDLPLTVACKTGSPQLAETYGDQHYTNSVMIAYAPVEDPQIAVAIVLEKGGGGANAAPLLADLLQMCLPQYWPEAAQSAGN